jgi:hypothetical protein
MATCYAGCARISVRRRFGMFNSQNVGQDAHKKKFARQSTLTISSETHNSIMLSVTLAKLCASLKLFLNYCCVFQSKVTFTRADCLDALSEKFNVSDFSESVYVIKRDKRLTHIRVRSL